MNFSVLMSVYKKENPEWFKTAVDSIFDQTMMPSEVVIVQDGELTNELYEVCAKLQIIYPQIIYLPLEQNCGLGVALKYGVEACSHDLIARMDTDDIARNDRFELQLEKFTRETDLDICGGSIAEFENDPSKLISVRSLPCTKNQIIEYCKTRNPFNHMTVMFKKDAVLSAGNYETFPLMEDYYLWYRMIKNGANVCNLNDILVDARIGNGMYERRGGWKYFLNEKKLYGLMFDDGFISRGEYVRVLFIRCVARLLPNVIREGIYKIFLRTK